MVGTKVRICKAPDCNNIVVPRPTPGKPREYCSDRCRDRVKMRNRYKKRLKSGLCPQCGGEMDYPISPHKNKTSPKYCSKCQEYYRKRYQEKKKKENIVV